MRQATHRTRSVVALLWAVLGLSAVTVAVTLVSGGSMGGVSPVLLAPAVIALTLVASIACVWGWSRGRERRREHARAVAPPLTWADPDVTEAALSDPRRRERMG